MSASKWLHWATPIFRLRLILAPFVFVYATISRPIANDIAIGSDSFEFGVWDTLPVVPSHRQ